MSKSKPILYSTKLLLILLLNLFLIIQVIIFALSWIDGYTIEQYFSSLSRIIVAAYVSLILMTLLFYLILKPIRQIEKDSLNNIELTEDLKNKGRKVFSKINVLIFTVLGIFSVVGTLLSYLAFYLKNGELLPMHPIHFLVIVFYTVMTGIGTTVSLKTASIKLKEKLNIYSFKDEKRISIKKKLFFYFTIIVVSVTVTMYSNGRRFTRNMQIDLKEKIDNLQKQYSNTENSQILNEIKAFTKMLENKYGEANSDFILTSLLYLLIAISIGFIFSNDLQKHLVNIKSRLKQLIASEGDLTQKLVITTYDEIGEITESINILIQNLNNLIHDFKTSSITIKNNEDSIKNDVDNLSDETVKLNSKIEIFNNQVLNQLHNIESLKNVANKTVSIIQSNYEQINNLNSLSSNNSANYEELTSSITSIFENTKQSASNSKKLKDVIDKGLSIIKETTSSIEDINSYNEKIKSMVNVISSIAETTNLLAMNAAIEAAHAGEKGKGFAVVASEIRKLAEISSENSKSISKELRDMSSKITATVEFSKKLNDEISSINYHVDDTIDRVFQIEQSMAEQAQNANTGLESIMKLNEIMKILKENSDDQQTQEKDMIAFIKFIEDFNEKIKELLTFQKNMGNELSSMFYKVSDQYNINEIEITKLWEKVKNIKTQI